MAIHDYLRLYCSYLNFPMGHCRCVVTLYQVLRRRVSSIKTKILTYMVKPMPGDFPQDILVEILHRLPLKSLVRFSSVCKAWNSLITDHSFIFDHLNRTIQASNGNGSLFFLLYCNPNGRRRWPYADFHIEEFYSLYSGNQQNNHLSIERFPLTRLFKLFNYSMVVGTCHGLICIADYSTHESATILIWNPSIRKYMVLPKPNVTCNTSNREDERYGLLLGFGFDSKNKDYKVIRVVILREERKTKVEVYSLASRSWRSITGPPFLPPLIGVYKSQAFVNGFVHWVIYSRCDDRIHNYILSFDVVGETFGELALPQHLRKAPSLLSILEGGNSLSVFHSYVQEEKRFCSIWTMKEYGDVESWDEALRYECVTWEDMFPLLAYSSNGKVLVLRREAVVLLDPMRELVKSSRFRECIHAFVGSYVESLVFLNKESSDVLSY